MNLSFRRCALAVGLCAGLMQSPVQAAEAANLLANLNAQRLGAYQLQTLFHLLTIEEGASAVAQQLSAAASSFALQVEQLDELSAGLGLDAEVAGVQAEARRLRGLAESNEIISQGYVDLHTQNDLSISASALTPAASGARAASSQSPICGSVRRACNTPSIAAISSPRCSAAPRGIMVS